MPHDNSPDTSRILFRASLVRKLPLCYHRRKIHCAMRWKIPRQDSSCHSKRGRRDGSQTSDAAVEFESDPGGVGLLSEGYRRAEDYADAPPTRKDPTGS